MSARLLLLGIALLAVSACKTKPSAAVYEGTGPSIHYHEAEAAGGPMRTSKYH